MRPRTGGRYRGWRPRGLYSIGPRVWRLPRRSAVAKAAGRRYGRNLVAAVRARRSRAIVRNVVRGQLMRQIYGRYRR